MGEYIFFLKPPCRNVRTYFVLHEILYMYSTNVINSEFTGNISVMSRVIYRNTKFKDIYRVTNQPFSKVLFGKYPNVRVKDERQREFYRKQGKKINHLKRLGIAQQ